MLFTNCKYELYISVINRKLIPGCGARLLLLFNTRKPVRPEPIKTDNLCEIPSITNPAMTLSNQDYYDSLNIYTQYGDLTPSQIFTLFNAFRTLPDYSNCNFLPSLQSVLLKMHLKQDEQKNTKESVDAKKAAKEL